MGQSLDEMLNTVAGSIQIAILFIRMWTGRQGHKWKYEEHVTGNEYFRCTKCEIIIWPDATSDFGIYDKMTCNEVVACKIMGS